jgi:hypothetical protein
MTTDLVGGEPRHATTLADGRQHVVELEAIITPEERRTTTQGQQRLKDKGRQWHLSGIALRPGQQHRASVPVHIGVHDPASLTVPGTEEGQEQDKAPLPFIAHRQEHSQLIVTHEDRGLALGLFGTGAEGMSAFL